MLKHSYLSPTKNRTKSQSSENSEIDDDRGIYCSSTTTITTSASTPKSCQSDDDDIKTSARPLRTKVSKRRPPSGAENAVRRWNSFHSTRGECHPNKFRRDRKNISPSIDLGRRSIIAEGSSTRSWELRRGKSLAEKSSLVASSLSGTKEQRAASICFGKRNGGSVRRPSECFVLETSEMIVIDYPEANSLSTLHTTPLINSTAYHQRSSSLANTGHTTLSQPQLTTTGFKASNRAVNYRGTLPYRHSVGNTTAQSPNNIGLINNMDHHNIRHAIQSGVNIVCDDSNFTGNRPDLYQKCNRGSHSSDTSSAYSGSDTMTSVHSSSLDADEVDLSGLVESVVDSDEEDLAESMDSLAVRDTVRECLEKDPSDRTEDDIETLLDFTKNLKAFTNVTLAVRRDLCSVMVFAVVEKAGTMVMNDGEELDSWSVLINGHVEIEQSTGEKEDLQVGDSFGILPTMDKLYHRGVMRTKCHDCQFVCITQTDYYRIQHQGEENTVKHEEDGRVVMVTELRHGAMEGGTRRGHVVIRGTSERLVQQLIEENSMTDPTYVEDFLLTHRTFIDSAQKVLNQLMTWFESEDASTLQTTEIRERVTRVVLLWVNNHFTDFETDPQMMEFLEAFESVLEKKSMQGYLRLLHIACATKARTRNVTLARSSRDEDLHFDIVGGSEKGYGNGIFISKVNKKSKAEDVGLKRGDQILEVNGQSFDHVSFARAMEILTSTTHLSITVKSNLLQLKETLQNPDSNSPRPRQCRRKVTSDYSKLQTHDTRVRLSSVDILSTSSSTSSQDQTDCAILVSSQTPTQATSNTKTSSHPSKKDGSLSSLSSSSSTNSHKGGFMTLGPKRRLQRALIKMNLLPKNAAAFLDGFGQEDDNQTSSSADLSSNQSKLICSSNNNNNSVNLSTLYQSHSNPDLTTVFFEDIRVSDYPEHVLKVYKSDQTCKYLLVHKETTAHEVVMLALQEFGIHDPSSNFSLCEVSVGDGGMIKQRRLPEQLQNLAERIGLSSRYYLKTNGITETLVPDDMAPELIRESAVHFLQLNANELAIQLTFQDFAIFRQIESTEYVDDLFELKSKYGILMLKQFAELVNREMFWVVTEVCSEHNMVRRMKIIKQFVKIARHCKECKNFNSMFAIISGLGHVAVSRLRLTWEKLPSKYQKLFCDLQDLMDPSRNMSKYRQLVLNELGEQHPIIPFYPVVKKDLTFIHLGNDTYVDNLINFEKLRMIAKEVRSLMHMCSSPYDLLTLLELKGQCPPSSAMVALNQMSVSSSSHAQHNNQATVKRRKKSTAAPNPKKMFEEAQMVRRVKAYLNNMKVITDEDVLHGLSLGCEPSGGSAPNTVIIRKRHPSPTLSTTSSTSSTSEGKKGGLAGPKFGAASPQAVKKILSLSEPSKTRPHQPRHPGIIIGPVLTHHHGLHHSLHHSSVSPSPSPGAHRRMGSSSSAGSMTYSTHAYSQSGGRAVHERSHSDTPTPLPSVNLSVESSSVTSLSNLPLRKNITSGSVTSSDSGHGSCIQADTHSNCSESGIYHVASSIVHNLPSPILQQRRHSTMHGPTYLGIFPNTLSQLVMLTSPTSSTIHTVQDTLIMPTIHHSPSASTSSSSSSSFAGSSISLSTQHSPNNIHGRQPFPSSSTQIMPVISPLGSIGAGGVGNTAFVVPTSIYLPSNRPNGLMAPPQNSKVPRHPPAYSVAAQMARLHRIGRAHSHEGVTLPTTEYLFTEPREEDDDEDAQVSAV